MSARLQHLLLIMTSLIVFVVTNIEEAKNATILLLNETDNWNSADRPNLEVPQQNYVNCTDKKSCNSNGNLSSNQNIVQAQKFIGDLLRNNSNTEFNKTVNEIDFISILSTINNIKHNLNSSNIDEVNTLVHNRSNQTNIDLTQHTESKIPETVQAKLDQQKTMEKNLDLIRSTNTKTNLLDLFENISIGDISRGQLELDSKNISAIIIAYCNTSNSEHSDEKDREILTSGDLEYFESLYGVSEAFDKNKNKNLTLDEKEIILEATEYGLEMMHQLYAIREPELYAMGMWLDDTNPARYVAAFNAPSEDADKYFRYGYATLQATAKLQLLRGTDGLQGRNEENLFPGAEALRDSSLLDQCPTRRAPKCPPASKRYRTHDGTCNNLSRLRWGATMTPVQRFLPPSYSDGIQAPRKSVTGSKLPSPREISLAIHEDHDVETSSITHMLMQWGQFIDHDITASSQTRGFNGSVPRCCKEGGKDFVPKHLLHPECMPIVVPELDHFYGPKGVRCLEFVRSSPASKEMCSLGWRDQINQVSGFLDGSPLYGSSASQSDKLRLFRTGLLQYGRVNQRKPVLSTAQAEELCKRGAASSDCFRSGDGRVNEHPGLVAMHIVWLRRHNRMAQELAHLNPHWSDEKIYQETRKIVGAMIQHITYEEFLPIVLGPEVMRIFELKLQKRGYIKTYNQKVNPTPSNSFGTAAFRFGHSLVQPSLLRFDKFHRPVGENVSLHEEPSNPSNIWSAGAMDRIILGMINQPIRKRDEFITDELTNHLFQTPQFKFGMDLAAINIQRGRDHGLAPYTDWREPCGLSSIKNFEDLFKIMPARAVQKLPNHYRHVDDIDLFTGGMAERPVVGGLVGPTFACIIAQQFSNLKKGDRFWYENGGLDSSFTPAQLQQIRRISLSQILCHTLDNIDTIQPFVFLASDDSNNERNSCRNGFFNSFDLSAWIELEPNDIDFEKNEKIQLSTKKPERRFTKKPVIRATTKSSMKTKIKSPTNFVKVDDKLDFAQNKNRRNDYVDYGFEQQNNDNASNRYVNQDSITGFSQSYYQQTPSRNQGEIVNFSKNKFDQQVISVTENTNQFTYLINYVPKSTSKPWKKIQNQQYHPKNDIIKVTYQNYDETYNQPPWLNSRQTIGPYTEIEKRQNIEPGDDKIFVKTSARSSVKDINFDSTTDQPAKLITFSHLGTYLGDFKAERNISQSTKRHTNEKESEVPATTESIKFSTFFYLGLFNENIQINKIQNNKLDHFESSTERNKVSNLNLQTKPKDMTKINNDLKNHTSIISNNETKLELDKETESGLQKRSPADELILINDNANESKEKQKLTVRKKPEPAQKTPSIQFEIIPSEISPSQWAIFEEDPELDESSLRKMPAPQSDPLALEEIPKPFNITSMFKHWWKRPTRLQN